MPGSYRIPDHMQWMGMLVVNLQSLEFALRAFLYNCDAGWKDQGEPDFLERVTQGQEVEANAFTNYDTLAVLIRKYNDKIRPRDPALEVCPRITDIRDALAHGRVASLSPSMDIPQRLVKYSKPSGRFVRVTDCHMLTKKWFDENAEWVAQSIENVLKADTLFRSKH
jgi:hypothetical protein